LVPTIMGLAAGAAGWAAATVVTPHVVGAIAGGCVALAVFVAGVALLSPSALRETIGMATRSLRAAAA
jgi:hypothetical protein